MPRGPQLWNAQDLECTSLQTVAVMDGYAPSSYAGSHSTCSFLDWMCATELQSVELPSPFDAAGGEYKLSDGSTPKAFDGKPERLFSLLFTSGSSGSPKAVAIGINAFVNDVSGDLSSGEAISKSLTVSYIPLSHSSDRCRLDLLLGLSQSRLL